MLTHIHVDMDGVVADLSQGAYKLYSGGYEDKLQPVLTWDGIGDAIKRTLEAKTGQPYTQITDNTVWAQINLAGERFWHDLPKTEHADEIVRVCRNQAPVSFLTSLEHTDAHIAGAMVAGKLAWAHKHFPGVPVTFVHDTKSGIGKARHASPGHCLVDDKQENIDRWERRAPGHAFAWPQHYNDRRRAAAAHDAARLERYLIDIRGVLR